MHVKCPHCGSDAEYLPGDSEMCSECGAELKPPETIEKKEVFSGLNMSELLSKVANADHEINPRTEDDSSAERTKRLAEELDSESSHRSSRGDQYLEIEYNRNLFFVRGASSVIRLRLIPCSNLLRGVMLFMETDGAKATRVRREIPVTELLQNGVPVELRLSYCPEEVSGRVAFDFYVGCNLETETKYYQFSVEHKIYDPEQSSHTMGQIIINQEIKASEAGDVNFHDNIGDAIREMGGKAPTAHELIDRLNDLPPSFVRQELRSTTWRPETTLIGGNPYPGDRLLLEWNDKRLFLLGKKHLKLGRSPELCDLVIKSSGGGRLGPRDYPNNTVSRIHAEILYNGDFVQLFDKSSYGTYINDRRPDGSGIRIPESSSIEFGDIHFQINLQQCQMRQANTICQTCVANRLKSMTFSRKDHEPEYYIFVWQCCELGLVIPELADWTVFFRDNAFFIRTPEQSFYYLRPGNAFNINRQTLKINYFQQS